MTTGAWCQTDAQGRALAWQLYEAYEAGSGSGSYSQFESLFLRDPQLTRRAFVSTMEYATEVYQQDMEGAQEALSFANELATLIASQLGDSVPSTLMRKLFAQEPTATSEFATYAIALYPGYSSASSASYGPDSPQGPGGGYSQGPGYPQPYGPALNPPYNPGTYGPASNPGYGPGNPSPYGPNTNPGVYADIDSEEDGMSSPDQSQYPYGPGTSSYGPAASPQGPGMMPSYGPGAGPFRPANATGGPVKP